MLKVSGDSRDKKENKRAFRETRQRAESVALQETAQLENCWERCTLKIIAHYFGKEAEFLLGAIVF